MKKVVFQKRRLQKLADLLRTVPRNRFNMSSWATGRFCNITKPTEAQHTDCGTSACALGWACTIPSFQRAGLRMEEDYRFESELWVPKYKSSTEINAGIMFFGLSNEEAANLFLVSGEAKTVARRIERVIANHTK